MESSFMEYMGTVKCDTKLLEYAVAMRIVNIAQEVTKYLAGYTSRRSGGIDVMVITPMKHFTQSLRPVDETDFYYIGEIIL